MLNMTILVLALPVGVSFDTISNGLKREFSGESPILVLISHEHA